MSQQTLDGIDDKPAAKPAPDKGGRMEEWLRDYFLSAGYFAVRGVPVIYGAETITDVDLWLYMRPSAVTRERANVDAKYKQSPKALERVPWAKGLQAILGLESCIVATTDTRPIVKEYGRAHDVLVLDGAFLQRLSSAKVIGPERLPEEELLGLIGDPKDDKITGGWKPRLLAARARLLHGLDFDGCNKWLEDAKYFLHQSMAGGRREAALRITYLTISYLLLGLDYSLRALAFEEVDVRRRVLADGFRFGSRGRPGVEETLENAQKMIAAFGTGSRQASRNLSQRAMDALQSTPVEPLAEFFARQESVNNLFNWARGFEARAYVRQLSEPSVLEAPLMAILGALVDFWDIDRRLALG
jgi:hypothetical protein